MPDTVTVTGKVGPNITATTIEITNVTEVKIDTVNSMIFITGVVGSMAPKIHEFDIAGSNTISVTKSAYNWTITISA